MSCLQKGIVLIIDGIGDRPVAAFNGQTPLEAAATPNFDQWVTEGICGLVDPLIAGLPVSTHTGTSVLMGMATTDAYHLSRGPIEALGIDLPIEANDLTMRCNFATLEETGGVLCVADRRAGRITSQTDELTEALRNIRLENGITANLHPATSHRAVLRLTGEDLSMLISDTDPGDTSPSGAKVKPCQALAPEAEKTAAAVNQVLHKIHAHMRDHPVNLQRKQKGLLPATGIITRGAGKLGETHSMLRHLGIRVAVVASERTVLGLTKLFGFTAITDPRFTAMPNTDLDAKVAAALDALHDNDLIYLHIKGTDVYGHDHNPVEKKNLIERIDKAVAPLFNRDIVLGVTADHSTDSTRGRHCGDPVPSLVCAPGARRDNCRLFGETAAMAGGLGRIPSQSLLLTVLDTMGCLSNYKVTDEVYLS